MRMLSKEGEDTTPVGGIPARWRLLPIKKIAKESTLRNGSETGLPVILCSKYVGFVRSLDYFKKKVFSDDTSNYKVVKRNWIAYPSNHIEEGSIGLQTICDAGIVSPIYTVFSVNEEVEPDFIHRVLKTELYRQKYVAAMNGSVDRRGSLRWPQFSQIKVPVPPLPEQRKIVSILAVVDDKLDVISRQIGVAQALKQGLMQTLFLQSVGTQDVAEWPKVSLDKIAEIRTGVAKGKKGLKVPVEVPYLRVANVQDGHIDLREVKTIAVEAALVDRYTLQPGDVLMTEGGDFDKLGRGDVWEGQISPCVHQNHVFSVRPDSTKLNSYYLAALAASHYGRQYFLSCAKRTTNLASINSSQLKAFPVLLPSLDEQARIADIVAAADARIKILKTKHSHYQTLKRGLMQKLLTGEWRVNLNSTTSTT